MSLHFTSFRVIISKGQEHSLTENWLMMMIYFFLCLYIFSTICWFAIKWKKNTNNQLSFNMNRIKSNLFCHANCSDLDCPSFNSIWCKELQKAPELCEGPQAVSANSWIIRLILVEVSINNNQLTKIFHITFISFLSAFSFLSLLFLSFLLYFSFSFFVVYIWILCFQNWCNFHRPCFFNWGQRTQVVLSYRQRH